MAPIPGTQPVRAAVSLTSWPFYIKIKHRGVVMKAGIPYETFFLGYVFVAYIGIDFFSNSKLDFFFISKIRTLKSTLHVD